MGFLKCDCGNTLFKDVSTIQIDDLDFRVWRSGTKLVAAVAGIDVAECIRCGRMLIPSTSMMGKNANDPEVQAYALLLSCVIDRNERIALSEKVGEQIAALQAKCKCGSTPKSQELSPVQTEEEVVDVKATKRSRKNPKSSV
jgi:hypothetical protein